jgi:hypothetical protein
MIRATLLSIGLIMVLAACGAPRETAGSTAEQPSATVEQGQTDDSVEQIAIEETKKRFPFDDPPKIILSRLLASSELNDVLCVRNCASRSLYVVILEGTFDARADLAGVPTYVPDRDKPLRFVIAIVDPSSERVGEFFAVSDPREVRARYPDADVD